MRKGSSKVFDSLKDETPPLARSINGYYHVEAMAQRQSSTEGSTIIQINEQQIKEHLGEIVRGTVQETLNSLLDEEASRLCNARRYERTESRRDRRAGHYTRTLQTKAGEVDIRMPKLRSLPFETAIIERYRRRESSVEEALVEMYLAGVSVRRVEDITEVLWGSKASPKKTTFAGP